MKPNRYHRDHGAGHGGKAAGHIVRSMSPGHATAPSPIPLPGLSTDRPGSPKPATRRSPAPDDSVERLGLGRRCGLWLLALAVALGIPSATSEEARFGFSRVAFLGVNENDAQAAMKVYTQTLTQDLKLGLTAKHALLGNLEEIASALDRSEIDLFSLSAQEFEALEARGFVGPLLVGSYRGRHTEEMILLVHQRHAARSLADLKGANLLVLQDSRMSLANLWLDIACHEANLPPPSQAFSRKSEVAKPIHAVLPVFFRKADVCLVTRSSWDTMGELNPQVRANLRVVASSPPVMPSIACFGRYVPEALRNRIIAIATQASGNIAFEQLLALFKTERLSQLPLSSFDGTRDLIRAHRRLTAAPAKTSPSPR